MTRRIGTVSRGLRAPIIKEGDDLRKIVVDTFMDCVDHGEFEIGSKDVLAVTESILARAQRNYATTDQLAQDVKAKLGGQTIGVVFPILSRNRFAICLRGIAKGAKKVVLMLSYPSDEVGNHLLDLDLLDEKGIDPYKDVLTQAEFETLFGKSKHTFTDMDYVNYYKELIEEEGAEAEIIFANNPRKIVDYTDKVICADIHTRARTKRLIQEAGGKVVLGMDELLTAPVNGSGYNPDYGILGSNKDRGYDQALPDPLSGIRGRRAGGYQGTYGQDGRSYGLRRRRVQGSGRQDLGTGGPCGISGLHRRSCGTAERAKAQISGGQRFQRAQR